VLAVALYPSADVWERAEPVDAGVRAEVDQHDASEEVGWRQRLRVEPLGRPPSDGIRRPVERVT
jgi:hypothetical protein